jgi:serine/threonine kinase PknH
MASLIGQRLGQYELIALLGRGGMGTVYAARQFSMGRDVTLKVIRSDLAELDKFNERFEREVHINARLSHPHILKVFDSGREGSLTYLVMELVSGGNLADMLNIGPTISELALRGPSHDGLLGEDHTSPPPPLQTMERGETNTR